MNKAQFKFEVKKCLPTILSVTGILGIFLTGILGVKAGMEAEEIRDGEEMEPLEFFEKTWKCYILVTLSAILSSGCIIAGHKLTIKQIMTLSGIAAAGSTKFNEYRSKIREFVGAEKEEEIYEEVKKKVNVIEWVDDYDFMDAAEKSGIEFEKPVRYYDDFTRDLFEVSPTRMLLALYFVQKRFYENGRVSFNYWRDLLGLPKYTIRDYGLDGDDLGWNEYHLVSEADTNMLNIYIDEAPSWRSDIPSGARLIRYDVFPVEGAISGYSRRF